MTGDHPRQPTETEVTRALDYSTFFQHVNGYPPYPYQVRLAVGDDLPSLVRVPTGAGKTAAVVLAWLYRRYLHPDEAIRRSTPRRLVYCLPMRVLVEQVHDTVLDYLEALKGADGVEMPPPTGAPPGVHVLMGGDVEEEWHLHPEQDAIIIGTQDMLLSRALNRGYAQSRFRWPIPFGLLNNDCLWVFDEVQLMGAAVPTSTQLDAFRRSLGHVGPCHTLWMSATLQPDWLRTVDHPQPVGPQLELSADEREQPGLRERLMAPKHLAKMGLASGPRAKRYPAELASLVSDLHRSGTQTMVVLNTVGRAQAVYGALSGVTHADLLVVHSRFRPPDRQVKLDQLLKSVDPEGPGRIVVTTQVLEAGVDISSALLVTELAPWASMVQRFGRCNRYGEFRGAQIHWVDVPDADAAPYEPEELTASRTLLEQLEGQSAAPGALPEHTMPLREHDVLRRKDLVELFDTAPDLSGNDVDVSRFVRGTKDTDVSVFWRQWPSNEAPPPDWPRPTRDELCSVPIYQLREFMAGRQAWAWDHLDRRWRRLAANELWPGQVVALRGEAGGYGLELGWHREAKATVSSYEPTSGDAEESGGDDHSSWLPGVWQTLASHSRDSVVELQSMLLWLEPNGVEDFAQDLLSAALWHDLGKAHPVFQATMLSELSEEEHLQRQGVIWGKTQTQGGKVRRHARPHFRHELASLLALLEAQRLGEEIALSLSDLALYLVASHHGRVRLAIRSMPGRDGHARPGPARTVLGVQDGDELSAVTLDEEAQLPAVRLGLWPVGMGESPGGTSWLARALALRDDPGIGPFRLAYMEAILRAADARASRIAAQGVTHNG